MPVVDLSTIGLTGQQAYYDRMNTAAQTKLIEANAEKQQLENVQVEEMAKLNEIAAGRLRSVLNREGSTVGNPSDIANKLTSLATPLEVVGKTLATTGAGIQTGLKLLQEASEIRKRESDIENDAITAQQNKLENMQKGFQIFRDTMGVAQNESEWEYGKKQLVDAMNRGVFSADDETVNSILSLPWSPGARDYFNQRTISAADQARLEFQQKQEQRLAQKAANDTAQAQTRIELQAARDAQQKRYQDHLMKVSGTKGGAMVPTAQEVNQARDALANTVFKGMPVTTKEGNKEKNLRSVEDASNYVASLAKTIVRENQAITWDQAVQQAILRGQEAGVFTTEGGKPADSGWIFGIGSSDAVPGKPKFERTGKTADAPLAMPTQRSQMKKGSYYLTARGVAKWNGSAFESD